MRVNPRGRRATRALLVVIAVGLLTAGFQQPATATAKTATAVPQATTATTVPKKTALQALKDPLLTSDPHLYDAMTARLKAVTPPPPKVGSYACVGLVCVADFVRGWWLVVANIQLNADDVDTCCFDLSFHFPKGFSQGLNLMEDSGIAGTAYWGVIGWALCASVSAAASVVATPISGVVIGGICSLEVGLAMYRLHDSINEAEATGRCSTFMIFYNTNFDGDFGVADCRR